MAMIASLLTTANPFFTMAGAGEARSCTSQQAFTGWCSLSGLSSDRAWVPEESDTTRQMTIHLGGGTLGSYLVGGLVVKRQGSCCGANARAAVRRYRVEHHTQCTGSQCVGPWTEIGVFDGPTANTGFEEEVEATFSAIVQTQNLRITLLEADTVNGQQRFGIR
jgi:hypothetical protein